MVVFQKLFFLQFCSSFHIWYDFANYWQFILITRTFSYRFIIRSGRLMAGLISETKAKSGSKIVCVKFEIKLRKIKKGAQ